MAVKGEQTASCAICGKTAQQRISEKDNMNYFSTKRENQFIIWFNRCRDCFYSGGKDAETNQTTERKV